jgi:GDPmannose 4,6-dehydratase
MKRMMKKALVTGALGQDGMFLSEHLRLLGYSVVGLTRRQLPADVLTHINYIYGDLRDESSLEVAIRKSWPDEIYNLGGQVFVPTSWEYPAETFDVNTGGLARILKIVEREKPDTRVYQASSSEMFGNHNGACNEETPLAPMSPYGASKAAAHRLCALYRKRGLFVVSGMLFNHESERRGLEMVTRKIARHVAQWATGSEEVLMLGNLDSRRDWGFAGDYVKAMVMMLQRETPEDFVIGTGESHSVQEFVDTACHAAGIVSGKIEVDERMQRSQEIYDLRADASKAKSVLGWQPTLNFEQLVRRMVDAEMQRFGKSVSA